jgi:predicted ArsR family transcriptional regulator
MAVSERDVDRVGALADPVRRRLYELVCSRAEPVSRDQAAELLEMPRHQAKFHLDRLEAAGLLDAEYARAEGRGGPGAGRPAKRYRRAHREIAVTLPERRYDLAGDLLAEAIGAAPDQADVLAALDQAAAARGSEIARNARQGARPLDTAVAVLADNGYEPRRDGDRIVMVNCPFHALAETHTSLVCRMNHALLGALAEGLEPGLAARLEPGPDRCCVVLQHVAG